MRFIVIDHAQRTPEWFAARVGRMTGSRAGDALAMTKTKGWAKSRQDYRLQLVCERLTGRPQEDGYVGADIQRGIDLEPAALAAYEIVTGTIVQTSGFLVHAEWMAGCSLDGHIGDLESALDGIIEIKCPKTATHLSYIQGGGVPADYVPQVRHALWLTGAPWCDFISYDDRLDEDLQFFCARMTREQAAVEEYEALVREFLAEVDRDLLMVEQVRERLRQMRQRGAAA